MKIIENTDKEDFAGRFPACYITSKDMEKLYGWLFQHFQGYKLGIVIDVYGEEYPLPENASDFKVDVLFLDEVFDEAALYIGLDEAQKRLNVLKDARQKEDTK